MRIDVHCHAFAEAIVDRAMEALNGNLAEEYRTTFDGRLGTLVKELRDHGFNHATLGQIATKPSQFEPIFKWSESIRRGDFGEETARMILPLPSVHPADPDRETHLRQIAKAGYKGVKVHPYYQKLVLDSDDSIEYFKMVRDNGLYAITHAGFDAGFPHDRICDPVRVVRLLEAVPGLRLILAHFGAWSDWETADKYLIGGPFDIEISMSATMCDDALFRRMLLRHPADRLYFGSDWPWMSHDRALAYLDTIEMEPARREALMGGNAQRLLGL